MTDNTLNVETTSSVTAITDPIALRTTDSVRLVFKPTLVRGQEKKNWIKGEFIYQRKKKSDEWEDSKNVNLSKLKAGEGVHLVLTTDEVGELLNSLGAIIRSDMKSGLRSGKSTYVKVEEGRASAVSKITSISDEDLDEILSISNGDAFKTVKKIANILTNSNHSDAILNSLKQLPVHDIAKLNAMTGITTLKASLDYWKQNDKSKDEGQWQKYFEDNPFILSNILSIPAFMLNGSAYVGGKSVDNVGGNLCDFLFKSEQTENPVLIEIKTPATNLIGKVYRQTFSMSDEVSGSIGQILNYSNQLLKNSYALQIEDQDKSKEQQFKIHKPLLYVIIGNSTELDNNKKREAFELYRNNLKDINILTFDEVFAKVKRLISVLEESTNS